MKSVDVIPKVKCPNCGTEFPLTEAIMEPLRQTLQQDLEREYNKKLKEDKRKIEKEAMEQAEEASAQKLSKYQAKIEELDAALGKAKKSAQENDDELKQKLANLKQQREEREKEFQAQLRDEKKRIEQNAIKQAEDAVAIKIKESSDENEELRKKLRYAQTNELELRKKERKLEEEKKEAELIFARKLDEQTAKIKDDLEKNYVLKMDEQKEQILGMRKQIEDLKKKAEQGSQQTQGEALERKLEELLTESFPEDVIEPVPKGIRGADVLQRVNGKSGQCCGTIIWESKNTRNWSNSWLSKLKENQRSISAEIAVLATAVLPQGIQNFGVIDDIWITHWSFTSQLACALRINLIEIQRNKIASQGQDQKIQMLYDYLTSTQFKQRVETIVSAFVRMRDDLYREKLAMERIWSKRERLIDMVTKGTIGMYGDMEAIVGAQLPQIEMLQLPSEVEEAIPKES